LNAQGITHIEYHTQVVPTTYINWYGNGTDMLSNQFTFTRHVHEFEAAEDFTEKTIPGLFIYYDLSPFQVHVSKNPRSTMHFITTCCAIIGGVFTVSGLIESWFFHLNNAKNKVINNK